MAKTYFWLKIQDEFFRQKEIKILRKMERGAVYIIIYQKMLLYSLKNENKLYFDNLQDTFEEELAILFDEEVADVKATVDFLKKSNLMECESSDEFNLIQVNEMTGRESDTTKRVRKHRENKVVEDLPAEDNLVPKKLNEPINNEVSFVNCEVNPINNEDYLINNEENSLNSDETFCNKNVTPYIDIELEKKLEKEKDIHIDLNKGFHKNKKQESDKKQETNKKSQNKYENQYVDECVDKNLSKITKLYEQNIGLIYPANAQYFMELSEKIEWQLFERAIEICIDKCNVNPGYLKGIIKKWQDQNIHTLESLKAKELEKTNRSKNSSGNPWQRSDKNQLPVANDLEKYKLKNKSSKKDKIDEKMLAEMNDLEKKLGVS